jgi:arginyl-tRNA synthetase
MDILAASTWLRYLELCGEKIRIPSNAYRGDYVIDIAKELKRKEEKNFFAESNQVFENLPPDEPDGGDKEVYIDAIVKRAQALLGPDRFRIVFDLALNTILQDIHDDLAEFGVSYQQWFSERSFVEKDAVDRNIQELKKNNLLYERDGALWFRSTDFNDEKDRVMQRSNGQRTYFANDFAYHINKFERGFDSAIDIFGADHHGYIPRMKAGLLARGIPPEKLNYLLVQFVTLYRGGEQVQMSTRSGSFVTLRALREEVGNDVARFFYVMRKCEQHVDFDLDLAKSQTNENPVYYIQYAHARICSVLNQLKEKNLRYDEVDGLNNLSLLVEKEENQLMTTLSHFPQVIINAATMYEPHLVTHYLRELARDFHAYYNAHSFLVSEDKLKNARLSLVIATRQVLANALKLIGVSTPESM